MTDEAWRVARRVCTQAELEAIELRERGMSYRDISLTLWISIRSVRSRLDSARVKVARELAS